MEENSIDRIRTATFAVARRGYETREVEAFLGKLADWLEGGGEDEARTEIVRRELERVGQRTAGILASAEESAEQLRHEGETEAKTTIESARTDAARTREEADAYAAKKRVSADDYSNKLRTGADEYSTVTRQGADAYAEKTRTKADDDARQTRGEADEQAARTVAAAEVKSKRIVDEGVKRRRDIEAVIADLVDHRNGLIAESNKLADELRGVTSRHTPASGKDSFALPNELDPKERVKA